MKAETRHPVIAIKPKGDKETRARACTAAIEAGKVFLPKSAAWLAEFEHELVAFPLGTHDDRVDALSQFLEYMRTDKGGDFMAMLDRLGYE